MYSVEELRKFAKIDQKLHDQFSVDNFKKQGLQLQLEELYKPLLKSQKSMSNTLSEKIDKTTEGINKLQVSSQASSTELKDVMNKIHESPQLGELITILDAYPKVIEVLIDPGEIDNLLESEKPIYNLIKKLPKNKYETLVQYLSLINQQVLHGAQDRAPLASSESSSEGNLQLEQLFDVDQPEQSKLPRRIASESGIGSEMRSEITGAQELEDIPEEHEPVERIYVSQGDFSFNNPNMLDYNTINEILKTRKKEDLGHNLGFYLNPDNKEIIYMRNQPVLFNGESQFKLEEDDKIYNLTPGLQRLLTHPFINVMAQSNQKSITNEDIYNWLELVEKSGSDLPQHGHMSYEWTAAYSNEINQPHNLKLKTALERIGKLTDLFPNATPYVGRGLRKGKGCKRGKGNIVKFLPSDPTQLRPELMRLIASFKSGNKNTYNEINAIIDQLRRSGDLTICESKKLYKELKM